MHHHQGKASQRLHPTSHCSTGEREGGWRGWTRQFVVSSMKRKGSLPKYYIVLFPFAFLKAALRAGTYACLVVLLISISRLRTQPPKRKAKRGEARKEERGNSFIVELGGDLGSTGGYLIDYWTVDMNSIDVVLSEVDNNTQVHAGEQNQSCIDSVMYSSLCKFESDTGRIQVGGREVSSSESSMHQQHRSSARKCAAASSVETSPLLLLLISPVYLDASVESNFRPEPARTSLLVQHFTPTPSVPYVSADRRCVLVCMCKRERGR